mmetsp:Transcript_91870/g.286389  ORF Transcript_91870/g.286389 Transcript_91870/m.286389 type:complete len:304 (+) Transcript_91870:816-1727(+)
MRLRHYQASDNQLFSPFLRHLLPQLGQRPGVEAEEGQPHELAGPAHPVPAAEVQLEAAEARHHAHGPGRLLEGLRGAAAAENAEQPADPVRAPHRALQIPVWARRRAGQERDRHDLHVDRRLALVRGPPLQGLPHREAPRWPARRVRHWRRGERTHPGHVAAARGLAGCQRAGLCEGGLRRQAFGALRQERWNRWRRQWCRGRADSKARAGGALLGDSGGLLRLRPGRQGQGTDPADEGRSCQGLPGHRVRLGGRRAARQEDGAGARGGRLVSCNVSVPGGTHGRRGYSLNALHWRAQPLLAP